MNYDNPAARLLRLIEEGKKIPSAARCRQAWQQLLRVEGGANMPMLLARLGKAMELPDLTIRAIQEQFPQQKNTWTYWSSQVNGAFLSQDVNNGPWGAFIDKIDDHSVNYLRMASDLLDAKTTTTTIPTEGLLEVRTELGAILEDVLVSDLSENLKRYVARSLRRLINAIDEYSLTGALPLLDAVDIALGHVHTDKEYKSFLRDSELGQRILDNLEAMGNLVTVAVGLPQISQVIALLPK